MKAAVDVRLSAPLPVPTLTTMKLQGWLSGRPQPQTPGAVL